MENSNKIIPPHLNAEAYRTDTTGTSSLSYLDFIRIHQDGTTLIGCSELTGRYWNGGANIFSNVTESEKGQNSLKKSIMLTSGTADGCFVDVSSKVLLCEDSGALSMWSNCEDAWKQWSEDISVAEHDDAILGIDCLDVGNEYVTVGADGNIKVWDVHDMICTRNYSTAHSMAINGVSVRPKSIISFATGSTDQSVLLWDDGTCKPALDVVQNDCGVRCVLWVDENRLLFGDEAGILRIVDVRHPNNIEKIAEFPVAIHKLALHADLDKVAVACDNKLVTVYEIEGKGKMVYHDRHKHRNYVRGAAWDVNNKNVFYTLGWDGEVKSHNI